MKGVMKVTARLMEYPGLHSHAARWGFSCRAAAAAQLLFMVTNNAPFCHKHLRVKVKKHIHHSWRTAEEDDRTGYKRGWKMGGRGEDREESCLVRYTINVFTGMRLCGGTAGGGDFRIN